MVLYKKYSYQHLLLFAQLHNVNTLHLRIPVGKFLLLCCSVLSSDTSYTLVGTFYVNYVVCIPNIYQAKQSKVRLVTIYLHGSYSLVEDVCMFASNTTEMLSTCEG